MKRATALCLALLCGLLAAQCGRLGPPRRSRPPSEVPRTVDPAADPADPNNPARKTPAP
jgi:hypothetical protein